MGARTLRAWLDRPLRDEKAINARLGAVEALVASRAVRDKLNELLGDIRDLERLSGRIAYGNASPSVLIAVSDTLNVLPALKKVAAELKDPTLKR